MKGLDYNTERKQLKLAEFGRDIQEMVNYALTIRNRAERQACAESIIRTMRQMVPPTCSPADYNHKLWDSLAIMSDFKLDIDYPFDINEARSAQTKPQRVEYPMQKIPVMHYGHGLFEVFEKLKTMPEGNAFDELVYRTANQMKLCLMQWSHGSSDNEKVAADLERFTNGRVKLDINSFRFETPTVGQDTAGKKKRKK